MLIYCQLIEKNKYDIIGVIMKNSILKSLPEFTEKDVADFILKED